MSDETIFKKIFKIGRFIGYTVLCLMIGGAIATVSYGIKAQCPDVPHAVGLFVEC
jgi:cell division protein FtsX